MDETKPDHKDAGIDARRVIRGGHLLFIAPSWITLLLIVAGTWYGYSEITLYSDLSVDQCSAAVKNVIEQYIPEKSQYQWLKDNLPSIISAAIGGLLIQ